MQVFIDKIMGTIRESELDPCNLGGLINIIYPVGHIITTENPNNPATYLGIGTWVSYGAGKVLVGIDDTQTEFDVAGKTGGEKTHKLTVDELPAHNHYYEGVLTSSSLAASGSSIRGNTTGKYTNNTGGDLAHNNLQPYITVYMWKRTD